jgi:hypothetical protein
VIDAALFLWSRSTRNWLRHLARRLKSLRYALAVLFGAAYLALVLLGQQRGTSAAVPPQLVATGGTLLVTLLVAKWWLFGADRQALAFAPAEIHFLFPAPVRRSALLVYKLARAQRFVLANVLIWVFLLGSGAPNEPGVIPYALGLWVFFSTVFLHRLGVALTRETVLGHGRAGLRRAWPALAALLLVSGALWLTLERLPAGSLTANPGGAVGALQTLLHTAPLAWVLWPFGVPLLPLAAQSSTQWAVHLVPALGLAALHVIWVIRADRHFGEAAIEASARRAEMLERWRKHGEGRPPRVRRVRQWFRLAQEGHPVSAIAWKNLTRLIRSVSPAFVVTLLALGLAALGLAAGASRHEPEGYRPIAVLALGWALVLSLLGPQWIRIDLRGDLDHLSTLKTWPLTGRVLLTGEVISSASVLTLLQAALLGIGLTAIALDGSFGLPRLLLLTAALPVLLLLGALNVVALSIQNGAAIFYPAWVRTEIRPGGIEQMGQHLLTAGASLILLLLAAIGPFLVAGGVAFLCWSMLGKWALVPAALIGAAGLGLEGLLLLDWLGARFERMDPSSQ